jgi:transcriptional regulator with XRE-family HTH domain
MTETHPDVRVEFAAYLERLRTTAGLSVPELAVVVDLEPESIEEILRAESELPLDLLLRLARGLRIPPGAFIDGFPELPEVD